MAAPKRYKSEGGEKVQVEFQSLEQIKAANAETKENNQSAGTFGTIDTVSDGESTEERLAALEELVNKLDKTQIKIAGDFDGTDVQVSINGIRKKIATTAP